MGPQMKKAIKLMANGHFYETSELAEKGLSGPVLKRLKEREIVHSLKKGVYYLDEKYMDEPCYPVNPYFEGFALGLMNGGDTSFVHLYSAAAYHELCVDGNVQHITLGVDRDRGLPGGDEFKYKKMVDGPKTKLGIETFGTHRGVPIRMTNLERTVVDLVYHSPLNGRRDVDEETAVDALNRYAHREDRDPALLDKISRQFGVEKHTRIALKNASRSIEDEGTTLTL